MATPVDTTTVGILGTGRMAVRLAGQLVRNGHKVLLGSRTPQRAAAIAAKFEAGAVTGCSYEQALEAPYVLPAIFVRDGLFELLARHADTLRGKTVLDILNPFNEDYSGFVLPWDTSAGEQLARLLPATRVVGIFKNVFWETFGRPDFAEGWSDVYVTGDDAGAKQAVIALFERSPFRFIDAGGTQDARFVERMTLFAAQLRARLGYSPRIGWRLLGRPPVAGERDPYDHFTAVD
jgi:8-hydroxy-5-deazaflavin:NADPH oxidoreductase